MSDHQITFVKMSELERQQTKVDGAHINRHLSMPPFNHLTNIKFINCLRYKLSK